VSALLTTDALAELTWLEIDLTLIAHRAPRRAHPLVVLEALFKGVYEAAGFDPQQVKQIWHSPGQNVHSLGWQPGSRIAVTLQLFGLPATQTSTWQERLKSRLAPSNQQNFTLDTLSPWRIGRLPEPPAETSTLTLDFLTPVPLPHTPGYANTALDGNGFLRLCQTRLRKLFGKEASLPPPPTLDTSAWRYWRITHHSRSQNGHPMYLNGCIGPLHLSGESLIAWRPWLALFSAVGLGQRLSFSQGRFRLATSASPQTTEPQPTTSPSPPAPPKLRRPFVLDYDQQGAVLRLDNGNLVISHNNQRTHATPLMRIAHIEIYSPCMLSTSLLQACARENIPVLMAAPGQTPLVIAGLKGEAKRNRILAAHHAAWNALTKVQRTRIAAGLVDQKLAAYGWLIRQRYQPGDHLLLEKINRARQALSRAEQLNVVRGWEGWAARHYYRWLQRHLQPLGNFSERQHHGQSSDPSNSLLNYGYGLLRHRLTCGIRLAGLDPWLGILHEANGRHQALVSDLMEPWRPHIDRMVLRWVGLKMVRPESFSLDDGELRLLPKVRERIVQDFTRMLETTPRNGGSTLASRIHAMIERYVEAVMENALVDWCLAEPSTTLEKTESTEI